MRKDIIKLLVGVMLIIPVIILTSMYFYATNTEVRLYNKIEQMSENRENVFDSMWKQIKQVAQVAEKDKEAMLDMVKGYMSVRTGIRGEKSLVSMLKESYPNLPQLQYIQIINVITGKRDEFQRYQTELKDVCREYKNHTETIPNRWFVKQRDISKVCKIIGSDNSDNVMKTFKDNDIKVF